MTSPAAEMVYLAEHRMAHGGKGWAVFNPSGRDVESLPVIYGFNNGGEPGWYSGIIMAEDGTCLGGHACSHEGYMEHDLGVLEGSRPDRHETFRKHYPDGYRMEFVRACDVLGHEGLKKAYTLNQAMRPDGEGADR